MGLISWLKKLFEKKEPKHPFAIRMEKRGWHTEERDTRRGIYVPRKLPKPESQIISRGYGKHFNGKGKHQHKDYRRSVKARKQPEED